MSKSTKTILIVVVTILVILLLCCIASMVAYYLFSKDLWREEPVIQDSTSSSTTTVTTQEVEIQTDEDEQADDVIVEEEIIPEETGTIKGKVGFPSEYMPSQKVCGENVSTNITICSEEIKGTNEPDFNGLNYTLELPVGKYFVYAKVTDQSDNFYNEKAYYTDFVVCGLDVSCTSHKYVVVEVGLNTQQTNIDPIDWYAP